jgi:signal transduction histidine kinase
LLGQLVDNLLENACKYTETGSLIVTHLKEEEGEYTLSVQDRGPGISTEDLPHVFEPFYRSDQARKLGIAGVGLGLAVVQRIAQALGGRIDVASQVGSGSRFTLWLPKATSPAVPPPAPIRSENAD